MPLDDDLRTLRARIQADRDRRPLPPEGSAPGVLIGQVFNGGAMPTAVPGQFAVHPVTIGGTEAEGRAVTITPDATSKAVVTVLGPAVPQVGDVLIARQVGGRWEAMRGGGARFQVSLLDCAGPRRPTPDHHIAGIRLTARVRDTGAIIGTFVGDDLGVVSGTAPKGFVRFTLDPPPPGYSLDFASGFTSTAPYFDAFIAGVPGVQPLGTQIMRVAPGYGCCDGRALGTLYLSGPGLSNLPLTFNPLTSDQWQSAIQTVASNMISATPSTGPIVPCVYTSGTVDITWIFNGCQFLGALARNILCGTDPADPSKFLYGFMASGSAFDDREFGQPSPASSAYTVRSYDPFLATFTLPAISPNGRPNVVPGTYVLSE